MRKYVVQIVEDSPQHEKRIILDEIHCDSAIEAVYLFSQVQALFKKYGDELIVVTMRRVA